MSSEVRLAEILASTGHSSDTIELALADSKICAQLSEYLRKLLDDIDYVKETSDEQLELFLEYTFAEHLQIYAYAKHHPRSILRSLTRQEQQAVCRTDFRQLFEMARPKRAPRRGQTPALSSAMRSAKVEARERYRKHQERLAGRLDDHRKLEKFQDDLPGDSYARLSSQGIEYLVAFTEMTVTDLVAIPWIGYATVLKLKRLFRILDCNLKEN